MTKRFLIIVTLTIFLLSRSRCTLAYGVDVHFNLTYVLCRLAGLPAKDALWIADADQSMDDNDCTTAFSGLLDALNQQVNPFKRKVWVRNGRDWHAFSNEGGEETVDPRGIPTTIHYDSPPIARAAIKTRLDALWQRVLHSTHDITKSNSDATIQAEIAMGQFLHFEQDYFSHRQLTLDYLNDDKYLPYGPFWGHVADKHVPDYVGARPSLANRMIQDSYTYIRGFTKALYGKDLAEEISQANLKLLIYALANSYHFYHDPTATDLFGNTQPYLRVKREPSQLEVQAALSKALQSVHATEWGKTLPLYTRDKAKDEFPFKLPYDDPKMELSKVKQRINALEKNTTLK